MQATQEKIRTPKQNNSLHQYCEEISQELNERGITMTALIENLEIDHSKESVKSIWRAIAKAKYGKTSTKDLTTTETQNVFLEMNRMLATYGIHVRWPAQENTEEYLSSLELSAPLK